MSPAAEVSLRVSAPTAKYTVALWPLPARFYAQCLCLFAVCWLLPFPAGVDTARIEVQGLIMNAYEYIK